MIYYVNKSGSDANDGLSNDTAWLTINYAFATAPSGSTIKIGSGVYVEWVGEQGKAMTFEADGYVVIQCDLGANFILRCINAMLICRGIHFKANAIIMAAVNGGTGSIIENCIFETNTYGIITMPSNNIRRNLFIGGHGINGATWDGRNSSIINNTFYNCGIGIHMGTRDYGTEKFYNNIFMGCTNWALYWNLAGDPNMNYNDFYNNAKIAYHDGVEYATLPDWQAQGYDANSIAQDPKFIDATKGLFGLDPTSPCISAGENGVCQGAKFACPIKAVGDDLSGWIADPNVAWDATNKWWYLTSGTSGKVKSDIVFDLGSKRRLGEIYIIGTENYPTEVLDTDNTDVKPNRRNLEIRYSDTPFLPDDPTPSPVIIERLDKLNIYARYIQPIITLRADGTAA